MTRGTHERFAAFIAERFAVFLKMQGDPSGVAAPTFPGVQPDEMEGFMRGIDAGVFSVADDGCFKRSRVHPSFKTNDHVGNWPAYDRGLVRRGALTLWISPDSNARSHVLCRCRAPVVPGTPGVRRSVGYIRFGFALPIRSSGVVKTTRRVPERRPTEPADTHVVPNAVPGLGPTEVGHGIS